LFLENLAKGNSTFPAQSMLYAQDQVERHEDRKSQGDFFIYA
jgi:hypothetical protein